MHSEALIAVLSLVMPAAIMIPRVRSKTHSVNPPVKHKGPALLRIKAAAGSAEAQYLLGMECIEHGDEEGGVRWLTKSAESGYAEAQNVSGSIFELGIGVATDEAVAAEWYLKAANQNCGQAATSLGDLYFDGKGVKKDYGEARRWLDLGAADGNLRSRNNLSWFLATCPDEAFRNGRRAINLLAHVVNLGNKDPVVIDTLAAAYAEAGMMDEAVRFVEQALRGVNQAADPVLYEQIEKRRDRYAAGWPWREMDDELPQDTRGEMPEKMGPRISEPAGEGEAKTESTETVKGSEETTRKDAPPAEGVATREPSEPEKDGILPFVEEVYIEEPAAGLQDLGLPTDVIRVEEVLPREKKFAPQATRDEMLAETNTLPDQEDRDEVTPAHEQASPRRSGGDPVQMERIVEKLVLIEELLRPLKTDDSPGPETGTSLASGESNRMHKEDRRSAQSFPETSPDSPPSPQQEALEFSRRFVSAILERRYTDAYSRMDHGFREAVSEDQMGPMIQEMYASYGGEPTGAELASDESVYNNDQEKRIYKFWYNLSGEEYGKGDFIFFTEITSYSAGLICTSFYISPSDKSSSQATEEASRNWYP
jgi:uncharacterized protein